MADDWCNGQWPDLDYHCSDAADIASQSRVHRMGCNSSFAADVSSAARTRTMRRTPEEEAAAAAYYEQHKDDADIWEDDPDQPPVGVRRLTGVGARITARFSPEETALLRQYGRESGLP